jgi:hypothetical protein
VQVDKGWKIKFKSILTHDLGDGVGLVSKWFDLLFGACEFPFLIVQLYPVTNLKLVWNSMPIVSLIVLVVVYLQNILNLLLDELGPFNNFHCFVCLIPSIE